jgi:hypothetical protein
MNCTRPAGLSNKMIETRDIELRELDRRRGDGIEVRLLWNARTNRVLVSVADEREGDSFEVEVRDGDALEAFHHPYAYAAAV